jgi:hypothetical protein
MKALISPNEGYRVAEIHETGFDVAEPLFWVDCPDGIKQYQCWYDPEAQKLNLIVEPETEPEQEE